MFEVDHKAGILASANALSRIVAMKSFQKQGGNDIIKKVCALKDDFPRQVSKTRLAIYELVRLLMTTPEVSSDLQHKHGSSAGFMIDLLQLCRSERDPECLMVWFDILKVFLIEYSPSKEVLDEVYGAFKLYFPIALPRASQTGITPEDLKLQLRKCFSATHLLSDQTIPFLLGKLDQGDGVTVNVKVNPIFIVTILLTHLLILFRLTFSKLSEHAWMSIVTPINLSLRMRAKSGAVSSTRCAMVRLRTLSGALWRCSSPSQHDSKGIISEITHCLSHGIA